MITTTEVDLKPSALTDWTYQNLKEKILNLEIMPGTQIHIEDFTQQFEVSRTPIREAFLKLAAEGLIEVHPRVGYFVMDITEQDIRDLFEIREIIESRAAKKAAELLSDEDIESLQKILKESGQAVEKGDFSTYLVNDVKFHGYLQKNLKNKRLKAFMDSLNDLTYRERKLSIQSGDNIRQTLIEHQRIFEGLKKRDGNLAEWFMGEHLHNVCERLVKFLKK